MFLIKAMQVIPYHAHPKDAKHTALGIAAAGGHSSIARAQSEKQGMKPMITRGAFLVPLLCHTLQLGAVSRWKSSLRMGLMPRS